ncbi:MAG: DUF3800 domain-containing protein [Candidatus Paceibacterota bacterium]
MNYRLYIDESGTHQYKNSSVIKERYLGLTGVILSEEENVRVLQPNLRELKLVVASDTDNLPILHREDIVNKKGDFKKLFNSDTREIFNNKLFNIIESLNFIICAVVLDKTDNLEKYDESAFHPYHYCLNVLLERYVFFLEENNFKGDVMAESRGKREDRELREAYKNFYEDGTYYRDSSVIQHFLTSKKIKIKKKEHNIAGLELADLLALATKLDTLKAYGILDKLSENFCKEVIDKIQLKYRRNGDSVIGYGKKLLN